MIPMLLEETTDCSGCRASVAPCRDRESFHAVGVTNVAVSLFRVAWWNCLESDAFQHNVACSSAQQTCVLNELDP